MRPAAITEMALPKRPRQKGTAVWGTAGWDDAMLAARGQAEQYVKALPASEPNPPFLIVVDVGDTIELFADFTRQGRTFIPFPDARTHRIKLRDLADDAIRERLRTVWTDPLGLDPSRRAAKVTRDVAARLAKLAQLFEKSGDTPEAVAHFLMRCLFTFFADDAGLLPKEGLTALLRSRKHHDIDPFAHLQDILSRPPSMPPPVRLAEPPPDVWFASHPSARRKTAA
jgi:hypothetical protein